MLLPPEARFCSPEATTGLKDIKSKFKSLLWLLFLLFKLTDQSSCMSCITRLSTVNKWASEGWGLLRTHTGDHFKHRQGMQNATQLRFDTEQYRGFCYKKKKRRYQFFFAGKSCRMFIKQFTCTSDLELCMYDLALCNVIPFHYSACFSLSTDRESDYSTSLSYLLS